MPKDPSPTARNIPITIKVSQVESDRLRRLGQTPGKGLRLALTKYWTMSMLRGEK